MRAPSALPEVKDAWSKLVVEFVVRFDAILSCNPYVLPLNPLLGTDISHVINVVVISRRFLAGSLLLCTGVISCVQEAD